MILEDLRETVGASEESENLEIGDEITGDSE